MEKCSDCADADVSKECRSVSPNPVRCPVKRVKKKKRVKDISFNRICIFLRPNGHMWGLNLCVLSEIYESETRDA